MANKIAAPLPLRVGDRERLETMTRSTTLPAGLVMRARLVLLASDGVGNQAIADRVGTSRPTVNLWRGRYAQRGIAGLMLLLRVKPLGGGVSGGGEPGSVAGGEFVVGASAEFEFADSGGPYAEVLCGGGEGEVLRVACGS